jgi:repressor LexA
MSALTARQRDVLNFIESFVKKNRYTPSFQEIADGLGLKSLATVHKHLTNLQNLGFLKRSPHRARTAEITNPDTIDSRFSFVNPERLWDNVSKCFWVKEPQE